MPHPTNRPRPRGSRVSRVAHARVAHARVAHARVARALATVLIPALIATPSFAQPDAHDPKSHGPKSHNPKSHNPKSPDPMLLRGPTVPPPPLPGVERSFAGETPNVPGVGARSIPMFRFLRAIRSLEGDLAPTPEQTEGIRTLATDFRAAATRWFEELPEQDRALVRALRAARQAEPRPNAQEGDAPQNGVPPGGLEPAELERAREITRTAPDAAKAQTAILERLTEAQQEHVRIFIARSTPQHPSASDDNTPEARSRALDEVRAMIESGEIDLDALPTPLANRLRRLPESRRAEALRRALERFETGPRIEQRPAPSTADVKVPPA